MSDAAVVALAIAAWLGALHPLPIPRAVGIVAVAFALVLRRPWLLVAAATLLASALAASAWAGLDPVSAERVRGPVTLLTDPVEHGPATRVDVRVGGRRVEAWARGAPAAALRGRLAGEVVDVDGRLRALPRSARARLAVRHVGARLSIDDVGPWRGGSPATRAANEVRRVLDRGMGSMRATHAALLRGFLIGDDRDVPAPVESDFRAAGLTHLLAVSGSNVAFVLAAAGPLLRRFELRGRLVGSLALIAFFALITRAEPSVLRASVMAAIACWAAFEGRPVTRLRVLGLAVAALVLVDPMLVRSVGFQLSVGASVGLALLAAPMARCLPGPRWLAEPLAVTLAAQVGVAPVLLSTFGGMPVVTVVANLLAVPVAGPLTAWGVLAGLAAGVLGGAPAALLHVPSTLMVWWIAVVARTSARVPLGIVDGLDVLVVGAAAVVLYRFRRVAVCMALAVLLVVARPESTVEDAEVAGGAHLWRSGGLSVVVLDGDTDPGRLLDGLRRAGVRRVDLVVARRGTRAVGGVLVVLRTRLPVTAVVAPRDHAIRGATEVRRVMVLRLGDLAVRLRPDGAGLDVDIGETADDGGGPR